MKIKSHLPSKREEINTVVRYIKDFFQKTIDKISVRPMKMDVKKVSHACEKKKEMKLRVTKYTCLQDELVS